MWDFLAPARYLIEKRVAGQSIPNVSNLSGRRRIQDFLGRDSASELQDVGAPSSSSTLSFDHSLWTRVLRRHVSSGHTFGSVTNVNAVDYDGIAHDPDFERYLRQLEEAHPGELPPLEQLAFWMNAYNALCIATVVHHEKTTAQTPGGAPLSSITQLSSLERGPVWDQVVPGCRVGGQEMTLNAIEHEQLRAKWAEPAVHACIVCASASCPNLRTEAFVASRLLDQMNDQMRDWLGNPTKGFNFVDATPPSSGSAGETSSALRSLARTIGVDPGRLELSRIFLWFADDFGGRMGLTEWLAQFVDSPCLNEDTLRRAAWRYFEYDWQLNRAPPRSPGDADASATATAAPEAATVAAASAAAER